MIVENDDEILWRGDGGCVDVDVDVDVDGEVWDGAGLAEGESEVAEASTSCQSDGLIRLSTSR